MNQEYINQITTEWSTGEREMTIPKKKAVDEWADTLEEANS